MSFSSDLDTCMSNGGFPTLGQIFSGLTDALQVVSELEDALSAAGIDITKVTAAELAAVAQTLSLSAEASALLARLIIVVATVTVSVYLGALLTCAGRIVLERHMDDELAKAPDNSAKRRVVATVNNLRKERKSA
jgi:hypothetical protein